MLTASHIVDVFIESAIAEFFERPFAFAFPTSEVKTVADFFRKFHFGNDSCSSMESNITC